MSNTFTLEFKDSPKRWTKVKSFSTLQEAQQFAFNLDPDAVLINVRITCPDGSVVKPKTSSTW
jgi:predicted DNA binding CopG/RHH family protein